MNILFPIAGQGSRFKKHNINTPKPFIKFKGREPSVDALLRHNGLAA